MWKMLHVWWKGSVYNIYALRSADSIHIIYIDLELIYLYFENIFGCNGVGSDSSEECHFLRWSDYIPSQCKRNSMMANLTRQKLGTRYETLLHSTQLSTVWGSTQLSAAGSGLSATRVGRICFCEWGDANLCWLSMGSLCKSDLILCNDIKKKQIISSEEIDTSWDISYKTPSEEILYLKEQQQQGPFFGKMSSACLALCHDQLSTAAPIDPLPDLPADFHIITTFVAMEQFQWLSSLCHPDIVEPGGIVWG